MRPRGCVGGWPDELLIRTSSRTDLTLPIQTIPHDLANRTVSAVEMSCSCVGLASDGMRRRMRSRRGVVRGQLEIVRSLPTADEETPPARDAQVRLNSG